MAQGLIHDFTEEDNYLIEAYDTYSLAIEMHIPPTVWAPIKEWSIEDIQWTKTIMKVQSNLSKKGGK